jgi:hypothetical protein
VVAFLVVRAIEQASWPAAALAIQPEGASMRRLDSSRARVRWFWSLALPALAAMAMAGSPARAANAGDTLTLYFDEFNDGTVDWTGTVTLGLGVNGSPGYFFLASEDIRIGTCAVAADCNYRKNFPFAVLGPAFDLSLGGVIQADTADEVLAFKANTNQWTTLNPADTGADQHTRFGSFSFIDPVTAVPEPGVSAMLLLGALPLIARARRVGRRHHDERRIDRSGRAA